MTEANDHSGVSDEIIVTLTRGALPPSPVAADHGGDLGLPRLRRGDELDALVALCMPPGPAGERRGIAVEVGSFAGEGTVQLLRGPFRVVYCVDLWRGGYAPPGADLASDADMRRAEEAFDRRVQPHAGRVTKLRRDAVEAAGLFPDGVIDLVYLDADHAYEAVRRHLRAWLPKVRPGGWLAGHDYGQPEHDGVRRAVDEVLGGPPPHRFPDTSWAWRKPADKEKEG